MDRQRSPETGFPTRTFGLVVGSVCLLIAISSIYTWHLLGQLHRQYLHGRGDDIAASIDLSIRGPRRRPNPEEWRKVLQESLDVYANSVRFMALVDSQGEPLAFAGPGPVTSSKEFAALRQREDVQIYEKSVGGAGRGPLGHGISGWRLVLGLRVEPASFVLRAAWFHLVSAALAIASLVSLAFYFRKTSQQLLAIRAREDAQQRLASLGRLSATLAHEIRNPLGAIKGLTQIVQERLAKEDANREHLAAVVEETERLEKLVQDLLLFSRPRKPKIGRVDLAAEIALVGQIMEPELSAGGVVFRVRTASEDVVCYSDRDALHQVLLNVVRNAFEASPPGREITVSSSRRGALISVLVEDQGEGLAEEAELLFEPFRTTKVRGTGLGLSVSKQIMEGLGGSIDLENRAEGGARCTLLIPALKGTEEVAHE